MSFEYQSSGMSWPWPDETRAAAIRQRDEAVAERDNLLREVADLTAQRDYLRALCGKVPQEQMGRIMQAVALEALTEDARP